MRITIINDGFRNCGGSLQFIKYANQMAALGHDVTLAYQYSFTFDLIPVNVERVFAPTMAPDQLPDADILLHSSWFMADRAVALPESKGLPFTYVLGFEQWSGSNEDIIGCWRLPIYKIVPSAYLQEQIWLQTGISWPVIPFGIDFSSFHQEGRRSAPRPGDQVIGALYNNGPTKRMPDLIATLKRLHQAKPDIGIELFGFEERPDLDFPFNYHCQPNTDELRAMMNRCHVWLSMSDQEGLHVPPMEAMACGAVPVSSDIGGTRDYCLEKYNGLRFPVGDTAKAAQSVLTILDDAATWEKYASRSNEIIHGMGSEEDNVHKMLSVFEETLENHAKGASKLYQFDSSYRSSLATLEVYLKQAERMTGRGEVSRALTLAECVTKVLEEQAEHKGGERFLSAHGQLYGRALAMTQKDRSMSDARPTLEKAALFAPAETAILKQADLGDGKELVKVHDNKARFDGHIRAYPTLACNLKCPHCVNQHVPDKAKGEQRLDWKQWATIFNREKRHVVLTGGEPFLFPGLIDLVNAIESQMGVRIYSNFSLNVRDAIASLQRPCTFYVSWHAGQKVDREIFWNNLQAVKANPLAAVEVHCINTLEGNEQIQEDREFFLSRGLEMPMDEDQRGFIGADPAQGEMAWCGRRIYLLSPEGVRYQCVSKIMRRDDPLENAVKSPLGMDRLLTLCDDWGRCAPCDGLGESVMHVLKGR